jgi:excinuclease ABC subunit C
MRLWSPEVIEVDGHLDDRLCTVPNRPAVFLIQAREGKPYLGRTRVARRRLLRLLGQRPKPSRMLSLREVAVRVEYRRTASWLETNIVFYEIARACYPDTYRSVLKLRMPPYLKVGLTNAFPRCYLTTRLSSSNGLWYGPFRTRTSAEEFESQLLSLFQIRRCLEDLSPSPDHPGCIYGEMNMCLRPCQQAVGQEEYASEVTRLTGFLSTDGRSQTDTVLRARDRASGEMQFEEAARLHKQAEKIQQVLRLRDDLVRDIDELHGVAVTGSVSEGCVELWFMLKGVWLPPVRFSVAASGDHAVSLDRRLRETTAAFRPPKFSVQQRQDHLALLARWYYSSFRDGEWLSFSALEDVPYRKLVRAISRVATSAASLHDDGTHVLRGGPDHQTA